MESSSNLKKADVKIVIVGESGVGKTTLISRYVHGTFSVQPHTLGAAFNLIKWGHHNVALWDTAGEEKYGRLTSFYCRGAAGIIAAYDITSQESFHALQERFLPLLHAANDHRLIIVVGTKKDLIDELGRKVSEEDGKEIANKLNENWKGTKLEQVPYFELSSKSGVNVKIALDFLLNTLIPKENVDNKATETITVDPKLSPRSNDALQLSNMPTPNKNRDRRSSCC